MGGPAAETGNAAEDSGHPGGGWGDDEPQNRGTPRADGAEES